MGPDYGEYRRQDGDSFAPLRSIVASQVYLDSYREPIVVPPLSSSVKVLTINQCTLLESAVVGEGVEHLVLTSMSGAFPILPHSLKVLSLNDNSYSVVDLSESGVLSVQVSGGDLRSLVPGYRTADLSFTQCLQLRGLGQSLPQSLMQLFVYQCPQFESFGNLCTVPLTNFALGGSLRYPLEGMVQALPQVQNVLITGQAEAMAELSLPMMQTLAITSCHNLGVVKLNAPSLAGLMISQCPDLELDDSYASTVKQLSIINCPRVKIPEWLPELQELTIDRAVDLPYIPNLRALVIRQAQVTTRGVRVTTIGEYRLEWSSRSKTKNPYSRRT